MKSDNWIKGLGAQIAVHTVIPIFQLALAYKERLAENALSEFDFRKFYGYRKRSMFSSVDEPVILFLDKMPAEVESAVRKISSADDEIADACLDSGRNPQSVLGDLYCRDAQKAFAADVYRLFYQAETVRNILDILKSTASYNYNVIFDDCAFQQFGVIKHYADLETKRRHENALQTAESKRSVSEENDEEREDGVLPDSEHNK